MSWVVYENEPFDANSEDRTYLTQVLGSYLQWNGRTLRIVGVCGQLNLPEGRCLVIRSRKAVGASLLAWIAYGIPSLGGIRLLGRMPECAGDEGFGHLVARIFCQETWRAIQMTGLLRTYRREEIRSRVVRGRIDFTRLARMGGDFSRLPCVVFSRLPQTPLNRLLAAAVDVIQRDSELRAASSPVLPHLRTALADVTAPMDRRCLSGAMTLSRFERPFEAAAALARLIVSRGGLSDGEQLTSLGFLIDLSTLFENSVARAFRESCLDATAKQALRIPRIGDAQGPARRYMEMEVDVMVRDSSGPRIIVDAKYKSDVSAANVQQVATYCWLTGARRAALVFPSGVLPDRRAFELPASGGNDSIRVDLLELDLNGTTLADWRNAGTRLVDQLSI